MVKSQDNISPSAEPTRKSTTRQALYRNYRPRSFKELVGQDHVTKTLEKAVKAGRISHAYLFTGPRGVGKTSAARILAHAANNLPYAEDAAHLDIIEIDAASNRRIDEIRDLRDKIAIAPAAGKYKVYIIDEVHMLTREAFNALLKTLEEPPAHIIFILATTEAHKLPETIISRTQRFEFKPLTKTQMAKHLQKIAQQEKIDISPAALEMLAEFGTGSFRDSIGYLDQLSAAGGQITDKQVREVLGLPPVQTIKEILKQVTAGQATAIIDSLDSLKETGVSAPTAASAIAKEIRQIVIQGKSHPALVNLLKQLIEVGASSRPYDLLEIYLLEASGQFESPNTVKVQEKTKKAQAAVINSPKVDAPLLPKSANFDISAWPGVVEAAKQKAASLYTALRLAEPDFSDGVLTLKFQFPLHQKKLALAKNQALVSELIEGLTGQRVNIECVVDKSAFKSPRPVSVKKDSAPDHMRSINNIFGPAEVMET